MSGIPFREHLPHCSSSCAVEYTLLSVVVHSVLCSVAPRANPFSQHSFQLIQTTQMTFHSRVSDQPASVHASPQPQSTPYPEIGSISGSGSSHSSALISDVPASSDPPSSSGKRQHHPDDLPTQLAKKKRLSHEQREATIAAAVTVILDCLDDKPLRQGLQKTPARYAKVISSHFLFLNFVMAPGSAHAC